MSGKTDDKSQESKGKSQSSEGLKSLSFGLACCRKDKKPLAGFLCCVGPQLALHCECSPAAAVIFKRLMMPETRDQIRKSKKSKGKVNEQGC